MSKEIKPRDGDAGSKDPKQEPKQAHQSEGSGNKGDSGKQTTRNKQSDGANTQKDSGDQGAKKASDANTNKDKKDGGANKEQSKSSNDSPNDPESVDANGDSYDMDDPNRAEWYDDGSGYVADKVEDAIKGAADKLTSEKKKKKGDDEPDDSEQDDDDDTDESDSDDDEGSDAENEESETSGVGSQNSGGSDDSEPTGIESDDDDSDDDDKQSVVERAKSFAKGVFANNPFSRGGRKIIAAGFSALASVGLTGTLAAVVMATVVVTTVGAVGVATAAIVASDNAAKDEGVVDDTDCSDKEAASDDAKKTEDQNAANDKDVKKKEVINKIYSVLKARKFSDQQIAGVLGNWETESSLDPTVYEGNYSHNFTLTAEQQAMVADVDKMDNYVRNTLFPMYNRDNVPYTASSYMVEGKYLVALGLGQWTGGRTKNLLTWSKSNGYNWWDLDAQLVYTFTADGKAKYIGETYPGTSYSKPEDAAHDFRVNWEGATINGMDETSKNAQSYYVQIKEMKEDKTYANSIIDKIGSSIIDASTNKVTDMLKELLDCEDEDDESTGGDGWQKAGGTYSGNTGGWQAWKKDDLPDELKQYAIDPESLGMKFHSSEGWTTGAANYVKAGINNQCTTLSAALMGLLWVDKDNKPIGTKHGMTGHGYQLVGQMESELGVKSSSKPTSGDVISFGSSPSIPNHTAVVSHVFENGDILIIEQNVKGLSGEGNGEEFSWSYQYVPKATFEKEGYKFASPAGAGYKVNPSAKALK